MEVGTHTVYLEELRLLLLVFGYGDCVHIVGQAELFEGNADLLTVGRAGSVAVWWSVSDWLRTDSEEARYGETTTYRSILVSDGAMSARPRLCLRPDRLPFSICSRKPTPRSCLFLFSVVYRWTFCVLCWNGDDDPSSSCCSSCCFLCWKIWPMRKK